MYIKKEMRGTKNPIFTYKRNTRYIIFYLFCTNAVFFFNLINSAEYMPKDDENPFL